MTFLVFSSLLLYCFFNELTCVTHLLCFVITLETLEYSSLPPVFTYKYLLQQKFHVDIFYFSSREMEYYTQMRTDLPIYPRIKSILDVSLDWRFKVGFWQELNIPTPKSCYPHVVDFLFSYRLIPATTYYPAPNNGCYFFCGICYPPPAVQSCQSNFCRMIHFPQYLNLGTKTYNLHCKLPSFLIHLLLKATIFGVANCR